MEGSSLTPRITLVIFTSFHKLKEAVKKLFLVIHFEIVSFSSSAFSLEVFRNSGISAEEDWLPGFFWHLFLPLVFLFLAESLDCEPSSTDHHSLLDLTSFPLCTWVLQKRFWQDTEKAHHKISNFSYRFHFYCCSPQLLFDLTID